VQPEKTSYRELLTTSGGADKDMEAIIVKTDKIRVLVVDDSAVVRQTLTDILSSDPEIEVMATAGDPYVAAERIRDQIPDVITLDIEMPRMDGLTFLKKIMSQHPIPVVICSSLADEGAQSTLKALEYGALSCARRSKPLLKRVCARLVPVMSSSPN
jgi:two-component system chemotaxis response regulator CheB